ncbi:hypothetical protein JCM10207_007334 [Rhodosporidiobolus poonsookiae]
MVLDPSTFRLSAETLAFIRSYRRPASEATHGSDGTKAQRKAARAARDKGETLDPAQGRRFRDAFAERMGGGQVAEDSLVVLRYLFDRALADEAAEYNLKRALNAPHFLISSHDATTLFNHTLHAFKTQGQVVFQLRRFQWRQSNFVGEIPHPHDDLPRITTACTKPSLYEKWGFSTDQEDPVSLVDSVTRAGQLGLSSVSTLDASDPRAKELPVRRWSAGQPLPQKSWLNRYIGRGCGVGGGAERMKSHGRITLNKEGDAQGTANIVFLGDTFADELDETFAAQGDGFYHLYNAEFYAAASPRRGASDAMIAILEGMMMRSAESWGGMSSLASHELQREPWIIPGVGGSVGVNIMSAFWRYTSGQGETNPRSAFVRGCEQGFPMRTMIEKDSFIFPLVHGAAYATSLGRGSLSAWNKICAAQPVISPKPVLLPKPAGSSFQVHIGYLISPVEAISDDDLQVMSVNGKEVKPQKEIFKVWNPPGIDQTGLDELASLWFATILIHLDEEESLAEVGARDCGFTEAHVLEARKLVEKKPFSRSIRDRKLRIRKESAATAAVPLKLSVYQSTANVNLLFTVERLSHASSAETASPVFFSMGPSVLGVPAKVALDNWGAAMAVQEGAGVWVVQWPDISHAVSLEAKNLLINPAKVPELIKNLEVHVRVAAAIVSGDSLQKVAPGQSQPEPVQAPVALGSGKEMGQRSGGSAARKRAFVEDDEE